MKFRRTKEYNFGWLVVFQLIDVVFLLIFFLLLSSNFVFQPGIAVSAPASPFLLGAQQNQQIISITGGAVPAIYFRDQKISPERLAPLLDAAKRENRSIIIKADRQTPYELVVAVTNAALEHGISSVSFAARPPQWMRRSLRHCCLTWIHRAGVISRKRVFPSPPR